MPRMPRVHCVTMLGVTLSARANDAALPTLEQACWMGLVWSMGADCSIAVVQM